MTTDFVVKLKRAFWVSAAVFLAIGSYGVFERLFRGHAEAHYGQIIVWGLWVAAYIFFIGLSAGAFLISSLVYVFGVKRFEPIGRLALFLALVTLLMALVSIIVDLGHMERAWHVLWFANFKSPMAWMIYLYSFYSLVLSGEIWFLLRKDLIEGGAGQGMKAAIFRALALGSKNTSDVSVARDHRIVKVLATIGVPTAIMFHGGVGALFGTVASRPHWHSGLFPILFILSALVSGGALLTVVAGIFQDGFSRNRALVVDLGKLVMALLALDVLFQISEFLIAFRGGIPGHTAGLRLVLFGPFWEVFWYGQLLLGTIVPLVLLSAARTRVNPIAVAIACGLIVLGIFGLRLNIVIPGLAVEEVAGLTRSIATPRMTLQYVPSLGEWALTIGIVGFGMLLFGLGELLLPRPTNAKA